MKLPSSRTPPGSRQNATLWENVLRHFKDAVIVLGRKSEVVFFNQAAEELTHTPRARVLDRACVDVFPKTPELYEMYERATTLFQTETRGEIELRAQHRSVPVRITCVPIWDEVGEVDGAALVIQDISRQKALEESARRNESLAQLGTLVAGLAHEVRNPLAGIKGAAQLLAQRVAGDEALERYTSVISNETDRLSALVGDLLHLGAPPKPNLAVVNIHEVLQKVLELAQTELQSQDVELICQFDPSLPDTMADSDQLRQVFLNLIKNATDAMDDDAEHPSRLRVVTKMETDYYVLQATGAQQSYLRVEINDEGPGIEPEVLEHVFEPFYTTKTRGTGLGLAIAQRIIADHGGTIGASANTPRGTSFRISLPIQKATTK